MSMSAHFFIYRPIFASVLSIVITIVGLVALFKLPIAQYPEVTPPTVQVTATYPGANAKTVADTVATPIEAEVNGVERMLYMSSKSTNDGMMRLDVTFELGTDLDTAQVLVQNRVSVAGQAAREVKRIGVTTKKSPSTSRQPGFAERPDGIYFRPGLLEQLRLPERQGRPLASRWHVSFLGGRLQRRVARSGQARRQTDDRQRHRREEQNRQVAAGRWARLSSHQFAHSIPASINTKGRLSSETTLKIVLRTGEAAIVYLKDVARHRLRQGRQDRNQGRGTGRRDYDVNSYLDSEPTISPAVTVAGLQRDRDRRSHQSQNGGAESTVPEGVEYRSTMTQPCSSRSRSRA